MSASPLMRHKRERKGERERKGGEESNTTGTVTNLCVILMPGYLWVFQTYDCNCELQLHKGWGRASGALASPRSNFVAHRMKSAPDPILDRPIHKAHVG
eukprot:1147948-Pelagomonas_calceolata.AAC.2